MTKKLQLIKEVSGEQFWEEGYAEDECEDLPSSVPRWFVDLRDDGKIRVNCLTEATIYLRNDGRLFHIQNPWQPISPLVEALDDDPDAVDMFIDEVIKRDKASSNSKLWECCEYIPDGDCHNLDDIWRVAAAARRTGRFLYTAKRETAKALLEDESADIPWVYASQFDQFTEEYELRYQEKIRQAARERKEREEYARTHTHTFEFNMGGDSALAKVEVDHFAILGVGAEGGPGEIKRAYWARAKTCHPDLHPNLASAADEFKQLSLSYSELMKAFDP